jgi:hypothetical protein
MEEEPKEETKQEPCKHTEIIWTSYTGGDEVIECALCGKELSHTWDNEWDKEEETLEGTK